MLRARLYTENKELPDMCQLASLYFLSYTVFGGGGVWNGKHEPSITFEVIENTSKDFMRSRLKALAEDIKSFNKQSAVLFTIEEIEGELVQ